MVEADMGGDALCHLAHDPPTFQIWEYLYQVFDHSDGKKIQFFFLVMARATSERKFTELKTPHCVLVFMQALGRKGSKGA
jgi:hypothetical protein